MSKLKTTQKRTSTLQKAAYILRPFLVYMVVKTAAMIVLAVLIPALPVQGISEWVEYHARQMNAIINAAASIIAAGFLLSDFLIEAAVYGEVDIDTGKIRQFLRFLRSGFWGYGKVKPGAFVCVAFVGVISAFAFNFVITFLTGLFHADSAKYEQVETIQYSVPLWLGLILYGLISPMVEELVFRGVIYNRMKRFYSLSYCVVLSALLFGIFHANLPQFLYGTCMGILLALCYEKVPCFGAPVIFHMAANIAVFIAAAI